MTREILALALEAEGLQSGNQGYAVPENREATIFLASPGDVFPIERVSRIELRDKLIVLENAKRERFYFAYDQVLGVRMLASAAARERAAGFGR
jgi:hypothetical protein